MIETILARQAHATRKQILTQVGWSAAIACLVFCAAALHWSGWLAAAAAGLSTALCLGAVWLNRGERQRLAAALICWGAWIAVTYGTYSSETLHAGAVGYYMLVIALGTLLDNRLTPWLAVASVLSLALEYGGDGTAGLISSAVVLFGGAALGWLITHSLKKSYLETRESERKLAGVFHLSLDGYFTLDQDGVVQSSSAEYEQLSGYLAANLLGKLGTNLIHPNDKDKFEAAFDEVLGAPEKVMKFECRIRSRQSEWLWVEMAVVSLMNDPRVRSVVVSSRNIHERKTAEETLRENEEKFTKAFRDLPVLISIFDLETGGYLEVNEATLRELGFHREEVIGRSGVELGWITPADLQRLLQELRANGMIAGMEMVFHKKNGGTMLGLVKGEFITFARHDCLLTVTVDITESRLIQDALRQSQEQLHAVLQTASDAIITTNADLEIAFWNNAAESMFGYSADEMIGRSIAEVMAARQLEAMRDSRPVEKQYAVGAAGTPVESTGLRKDGREFPLEVSNAKWETKAGSFVTAILRDITERKQHERELQLIASISEALRSADTTAQMESILIHLTIANLNVDAAAIQLIDPLSGDAEFESAYGLWEPLRGQRQKQGTGLNEIIARTHQPYITDDIDNGEIEAYPSGSSQGLRGAAGIPLLVEERLIGFFWIGRKTPIPKSDVGLCVAISNIAANAIRRAILHEHALKLANDLAMAYDTTLQGWADALELRDQETEGHSQRVVVMTMRLAKQFHVAEEELLHIHRGAILHDIGKMGVPDAILHKPGPLSEEEWSIMRQHPGYAYDLLVPIEHLRPALDIPYAHHEKWDGTGYPRGLQGEEIPLAARIFAIVDVWDALRFDRPYRKAWPEEQVQAYLLSLAGTHFDPQIVDAFLRLLNNR